MSGPIEGTDPPAPASWTAAGDVNGFKTVGLAEVRAAVEYSRQRAAYRAEAEAAKAAREGAR